MTHELDPTDLVRILNEQVDLPTRQNRDGDQWGRSKSLPVIAAGVGGCHLCTPDRQCSLCEHNAVPL